MKKIYLHISRACLPCILAVSLLMSGLMGCFPLGAFAANEAAISTDEAYASLATVSSAELLEELMGISLSDAETDWLINEAPAELTAKLTLTYDTTVPYNGITVTFPSDRHVTVAAEVFVGTEKGTLWTPISVAVDGTRVEMTAVAENENLYTATVSLSEDHTDTSVEVSVAYSTTFAVDANAAEVLANAAYDTATEAIAAQAAYEKALAEHTKAAEAYAAYQAALRQYKSDLARYTAYQAAMNVYRTRLAAYESYLEELAVYEEENARYEAYLQEKAAYDTAYAEYMELLENPAAYEQKYLAYCAYLADMERIDAQLAIIDSCFVKDSEGHVLNGTLNGSTVATVVERQDELVSVGCDAQDIANADAATKNLIALLAAYPKDGEKSLKYTYYIQHFTELRDNVTLLYTSLSRLYGNDAVPDILNMQGKKTRYWQFVAQLYVLSCALEDDVAFDRNWSISGGHLLELLESCFILEDRNDAAPMAAYPEPMNPVTHPAEVKNPTPPQRVEQPVAPLKVAEPIRPEEVRKPVLPVTVAAPGQAPVEPLYSARVHQLMEIVESGALTRRDTAGLPSAYTLTAHVGRCASADGRAVASFYDYDRMTLLASSVASSDGMAAIPDLVPERSPEGGHCYVFDGWADHSGQILTTTDGQMAVAEDAFFFATYTVERLNYTIRFIVDGEVFEQSCVYGEMPVFEGTPEKPDDKSHRYTFVGWSPAVIPVTDDAEYTAVFAAEGLTYTVEWVVGETSETEVYLPGEMPVYPEAPTLPMDGHYRYHFKGWSSELVPVTGNARYEAIFEKEALLPQLGAQVQATVSETAETVTVTGNGWVNDAGEWLMDVSRIAGYAAEQGKGLVLTADGISLLMGSEELSSLMSAGCVWLGLTDMASQEGFGLAFYDDQMMPILVDLNARLTLTLPAGLGGAVYGADDHLIATAQEGKITLTVSSAMVYFLSSGYEVGIDMTVNGGGCQSSAEYARYGETVTVTVKPAPGYAIRVIRVTDALGRAVACTRTADGVCTFTMPEAAVTVTVDFTPLTYTVEFRADGIVLATLTCRYGEMPTPPQNPTKADDEEYSYTFTGWHTTVTPVMGDAVYDAVFLAVPLGGQSSVVDSGVGLVQLLIIGVASFVVSGAAVLVPYFVVRHIKRKGEDGPHGTEPSDQENKIGA